MSTDAWPNGDVAVALGTGSGAFAPATAYVTGAGHREFEVADFDKDGDIDVATSNLGFEDGVSVLLNDGSGNLGLPTTYPAESLPGYANQWALDTGDVNGDGNLDIVVANRTGRDIGVYVGHGDGRAAPRAADRTDDGARPPHTQRLAQHVHRHPVMVLGAHL